MSDYFDFNETENTETNDTAPAKAETDIGHVVTADELTLDEGAIIREQERLAQEKKKKIKKKRLKIVLAVLAVLILAAIVWFFVWGKKMMTGNEQNTVKISTTANQSITFVRVDSVNGNEINYTVLREMETVENTTEADGSNEKGKRPSGDKGSRPDMGSMPEGFDPESMGGNFPGGFGGGDGEMPDRDSLPDGASMPEGFDPGSMGGNFPGGFGGGDGEMPDRDSLPDGASMPEGFDPSSMGGNFPGGFGGSDSENFGNRRGGSGNGGQRTSSSTVLTYDGVSYGLTENTATALVPVGTDVITKLGTKTTFSRISAGDCLALVTEVIDGEEVIMAVYIVG